MAGCCALVVTAGAASCGVGQPAFTIGGAGSAGAAAPITRALLTSDGRHLIVPVSSSQLGCWDLSLTAAGQPRRVVLNASAAPSQEVCASDAPTVRLLTTATRVPLWGRALIDGSTGQRVTYFDGRQLFRIGHPPVGYRFHQDTPWMDTYLVPQPETWRGPNAWVREYVPQAACPPGTVTLRVTQVQPAAVARQLGTGPVRQRVRVNGDPAVIQASSAQGQVRHSVTWAADGYGFAVVWLGIESASCPDPAPLPDSELLRVARSLRR